MQCTRCGYYNSEAVSSCIKCNTPLAKKEVVNESKSRKTQQIPNKQEVDEYLNKTTSDNGFKGDFSASKTIADSGTSNDFSTSKTIADSGNNAAFSASQTVSDFGDNSSSEEKTSKEQPEKVEIIPCPKCKYPISGASKFCPNCSQDLTKEVKIELNKPSQKMNKERKAQKTVNIFASEQKVEEVSVKLTEIKQTGEKHLELTSEDKKIGLNNVSLDQEENAAISSNVHAELINFEGEWYIVNRSSAGTTFVAAHKPQKLSEGDIILIGNTIYCFDGE